MREIVILANVPTDAVNVGFIPAAQRLGLKVVLLTDQAESHRQYFGQGGRAAYPHEIVACDVFNPLAVVDAVTARAQPPAALFSNSDHLQTSTAIAADYFGLPRKNWHATYRTKNKAEMRAHLQRCERDALWHAVVCDEATLARWAVSVPFPCIVKPREGVASQHVHLARNRTELESHCLDIWRTHPGQPLLLEEYIDGPLYTLETLGDGTRLQVLGGFRVELSLPPHFVETAARWGTGLPSEDEAQVIDLLRRLGVGFGACHTEFVMTDHGPRLIEINYRSIGDYREFLLQDALNIPLFELVLRLYLGEPLPELTIAPGAAQIRYFTANAAGLLTRAPAAFDRDADAIRVRYTPLRRVGETVSLPRSNKDYLGVLRGTGPDAARLDLEMARLCDELAWEVSI